MNNGFRLCPASRWLGIGILFLSIGTKGWCQVPSEESDSSPKLPPGPLVAQPTKSPVRWSVTFTYSSQGGQSIPEGNVSNITLESWQTLTHVTVTQVGGLVQNLWKSNHEIFEQYGLNTPWKRAEEDPEMEKGKKPQTGSNDYLHITSFPGADWINRSMFLKIVNYQGANCLLFVANKNEGDVVTELLDRSPCMAIVDEATRFPVIVKFAGVREDFAYGQPPTKLALPKDLSDEINKGEEERRAAMIPAPRPY